MDRFTDTDLNRRAWLLGILAFGSIMLWQTLWGSLLLFPFTILTTWFHEMGHALSALLVGETVEQLLLYADGSGVAVYVSDDPTPMLEEAVIAAGGPVAPALAGAGLIAASRTPKSTRWALIALGALLLLSTVAWVRTVTGWAVLPALGIATLAIAYRANPDQQRFAVQFLGLQASISIWAQLGYLFSTDGTIDGVANLSDTAAMAQVLLLPYWVWGIVLSAFNVALLWWAFRYAFRR